MSLKSTEKQTHKLIPALVAVLALSAISFNSYSANNTQSRSSRSISFTTNTEIDKTEKDRQLKLAEADTLSPLVKQGFREEGVSEKKLPTGISTLTYTDSTSYSTGEFSIYDASTDLISDFDFDGFYHRLSVKIDADTIHDVSYVYAKLYLSYEGGPWNHYATSNSYHIYGDSVLDSFIIETELADGYPPGYYDIRIELYDADYGDWLVSYGPYDDASLSALPLEDSYYDDEYIDNGYYIETGVAISAGSLSTWLLTVPALLLTGRLISRRRRLINNL